MKVEKEKPALVGSYLKSIMQCQNNVLPARLTNLTYVIEDVSEKSEGRYGSAKYKALLK